MKKYFIEKSDIHGLGVHANQNFDKNELIGHLVNIVSKKEKNKKYFTTKLSNKLGTFIEITELEKFLNHSNKPNATCIAKEDKVYLYSIKQIKKNEEITVKYKDAFKTLDKAQIIHNVKNQTD